MLRVYYCLSCVACCDLFLGVVVVGCSLFVRLLLFVMRWPLVVGGCSVCLLRVVCCVIFFVVRCSLLVFVVCWSMFVFVFVYGMLFVVRCVTFVARCVLGFM